MAEQCDGKPEGYRKVGGASPLSEYLCERDIEALHWHLLEGHAPSKISEWHDCSKMTVLRRMEKAINCLLAANIPVFGIMRHRAKVVAVTKLGRKPSNNDALDELRGDDL